MHRSSSTKHATLGHSNSSMRGAGGSTHRQIDFRRRQDRAIVDGTANTIIDGFRVDVEEILPSREARHHYSLYDDPDLAEEQSRHKDKQTNSTVD